MSDLCVECGDTVRPLQHALAYDVCDKWQHRTCGTGWHRRLNSKAGRGNQQMYVLLALLLKEAKLVTIHTQLVGEGVGRNRWEIYNDTDKEIQALWDEYDYHEIVCEEFLQKIGEIMG